MAFCGLQKVVAMSDNSPAKKAVGGVSASGTRKVVTLFGGFSRIEHPQYRGPDSIEKGKRIMDHIANIREVIERTRLVKKKHVKA